MGQGAGEERERGGEKAGPKAWGLGPGARAQPEGACPPAVRPLRPAARGAPPGLSDSPLGGPSVRTAPSALQARVRVTAKWASEQAGTSQGPQGREVSEEEAERQRTRAWLGPGRRAPGREVGLRV